MGGVGASYGSIRIKIASDEKMPTILISATAAA
jgi:hypothetical protein